MSTTNTTNTNTNASSAAIPGMVYPTTKGMLAGTPRASAIEQGNLTTQKLVALNKIGGKLKYRKYTKNGIRGGAVAATTTSSSTPITVPQFNLQYTSQNALNQDPNSIIKLNAANSTQGAANAVYDKYATVMPISSATSSATTTATATPSATTTTQTGGIYINPNTNQYQWGCYSGGKTKKRRRMNKKKGTNGRKRSKSKSIKKRKYRSRYSKK
jgi:hypothetical protein